MVSIITYTPDSNNHNPLTHQKTFWIRTINKREDIILRSHGDVGDYGGIHCCEDDLVRLRTAGYSKTPWLARGY